MKKYYIGLLIIGLLTLGLTGYVVTLGLQSRQDVKTEKSAQEAADKLNSYISANQKIPDSLSEAGVKDVPSTITYTKLSEEEYKFCVTYKAAKGYGGSADITSALTGAALSRMYATPTSAYDSSYPNSEPSSLYPDYIHKKGENCQTIKPYLYSIYNSSSSSDPYCDPTSQYYNDYKIYCTEVTPNSTVQ